MEEVDEIDHEGYSPHRETDDDFYAQDSCKKYEGIYNKIKALESLVVEKHRSQIACVVMYDITQKPFLKISGVCADAFLIDSSPLNVNVFVSSSSLHFTARLLTANHHVVSELVDEHDESKLLNLVDCVVENSRYRVCCGMKESDSEDFLEKLKKSEFFRITLTCYADEIYVRAKNCKYLVDLSITKDDLCIDCQSVKTFLSVEKFILETTSEIREPEIKVENIEDLASASKSKKGRPRKIKSMQPNSKESSQILLESLSEVKQNPVREGYESVINTVRRGTRERKLPEFMELLKRRRGRPPVLVEPFKCNECSLNFTSAAKYKKHQLEHLKKFTCEFEECGRRFEQEEELEIHTRKHNGEKPYVCQECDRAYQSRQDLRLHHRKHTGARPYKCEVCQKSFARLQQKKVHMAVHSGEKAFLCSECGTSFASVSTLIDHRKRRHLMVRNHSCPDCPKAFFAKSELESHAKTHTGVKPYECEDCGRRFSRLFHKRRHKGGRQRCGRPITDQLTTFIVSRDDLVGGDDTLLGLDEAFSAETVFITTGGPVLEGVMDGEIHDSEYVNDPRFLAGDSCSSRGAHLLLHGDVDQVRFLHLDDDLGMDSQGRSTILLQDSSIVDPSLVDMPVSDDRFVLITTEDNQQKMLPVAQIVNALNQSDH